MALLNDESTIDVLHINNGYGVVKRMIMLTILINTIGDSAKLIHNATFIII